MWILAGAIYAVCKWATWWTMAANDAPLWKKAAYLVAWPGMDASAFLTGTSPSRCRTMDWARAGALVAAGATLLFGVAGAIPATQVYLAGWTGMVGLVMMLHFGIFNLLSCCWRRLGVEARPLMNRPFRSANLNEFWGRRWNTAFRDLTHRFLFRPLTRVCGPRMAIFGGFVFSGAVHDLVISVPAGGGYGRPTLYFAIQGAAILCERSRFGRRAGLGRGSTGRAFALLVPIAPLGLLFHRPFVMQVFVPFLRAIGGLRMSVDLPRLIFLAGLGQMGVLVAAALVPSRLRWREELKCLTRLHRQMHWTYGSYIVLSIAAFAAISVGFPSDLASGQGLARALCAYMAVFWGIRLVLQGTFEVSAYLTNAWMKAGYLTLTVSFAGLTAVYTWAALQSGPLLR